MQNTFLLYKIPLQNPSSKSVLGDRNDMSSVILLQQTREKIHENVNEDNRGEKLTTCNTDSF